MTKLEMLVEIIKPKTGPQMRYLEDVAKNNKKAFIEEWYNKCKSGVYTMEGIK